MDTQQASLNTPMTFFQSVRIQGSSIVNQISRKMQRSEQQKLENSEKVDQDI